MKKIYTLITFIFIAGQVSMAQLTLTKALNEPSVGDMERVKDYDSTTVIPKNGGIGQTWNFSSFTVGSFTETTTYSTVASAPGGSLFPTASLSMNRGGAEYEFARTTTSTYEYVGNYEAAVKTTTFSNSAIFFTWPVSMSSSNTDALVGVETNTAGNINWNGTISYTATGTGTVILPGGNTHNNCLQVKRVIGLTLTQGTNTTSYTEIDYEYYSSSSKFPIIKAQYQTITSGTNTSKGVNVKVNMDAMSVGINENQSLTSNFIVYPNPASDKVNVSLSNNETPDSIEIFDMLGRVVASSVKSISVTTNELAKGVYTIRVKSNDTFSQKSLVIAE